MVAVVVALAALAAAAAAAAEPFRISSNVSAAPRPPHASASLLARSRRAGDWETGTRLRACVVGAHRWRGTLRGGDRERAWTRRERAPALEGWGGEGWAKCWKGDVARSRGPRPLQPPPNLTERVPRRIPKFRKSLSCTLLIRAPAFTGN